MPALTSSVALNRFAVVVLPLAPICSISFGLFGELAVVRKSGKRKPTKEGGMIVKVTGLLMRAITGKFHGENNRVYSYGRRRAGDHAVRWVCYRSSREATLLH